MVAGVTESDHARRSRSDALLEARAALGPRLVNQNIVAIQQDVEQTDADGRALAVHRDGLLVRHVHPSLQLLKAYGLVVLQGDYFTIQHEVTPRRRRDLPQRLGDLRKLPGLVVAV